MKQKFLWFFAAIACFSQLWAKSETKLPDSYAFTRGVEAYENDNKQEAFEWFNKEISDHPDNGYAYLYIYALRLENNEYGRALSAINQALKKLPKKDKEYTSLAYVSRARAYLAMEDTVSALKDLEIAIKLQPQSTDYYQRRAQVYYEQKRYDLADADYQKMITLDPGDVMGYMGIGRNANAQKQWDKALAQFNQAIKLAPDYSSGYSFRAETYCGQEKWAEATDDLIKALDIDGDNKAFYMMQNLPAEAYRLFKTKLKIQMTKQPTNTSWPYYLGIISQENNDYADAITYYEKANSLDANSYFLENISECYYRLRECEKALEYVDRALAMTPDDYDLVHLRADILRRMGRFDESLVERNRYITQYPDNPISYLSRGDDYLHSRRFDEAIADYNTAVILMPDLEEKPIFLQKRGDAHRLSGHIAEANKDYEHILSIESSSPAADYCTPFAYTGLGNTEKAIETIEYIVENDTTVPSYDKLYNAACIYARIGYADKAIEYLKKAIEEGYCDFTYIENDYDMDSLRGLPEFEEILNMQELDPEIIVTIQDQLLEPTTEVVEIPFTKDGGVTKVKCSINDLPLHFVFDTGAADVTMSMVEANFMLKNDYIKPTDIIGTARYMDANGDISEGTIINLRNVNFGGLELDNVRASVVRNQKAPLLLGQSVLGRLGKIEIDNSGMKLIITHEVSK